jgi:hypothetical protein
MNRLGDYARIQLQSLRRRPRELNADNAVMNELKVAGLVTAAPLIRPSGKPSRYREWSLTERGRALLGEKSS